MDRGDVAHVVQALVVLAVLTAVAVWLLRINRRMDRAAVRRAARMAEPDIIVPPRERQPARRPWWGNPWLWVCVAAAFVVLGVLVWPWLFGGVFLFVPFVWMARPGAPTMDPRSNGHAKREGPA